VNYLVAAYAAIWCILFIYLYTLKSRQSQLEKSVEALRRKVEKS